MLSGGWQQRERVHESADPRTFIEFDGGFGINAALGYRFDAFRIEAEYTFMNNECDTAGAAGLSSDTVGNVNLRAWMFNVYHDIEIQGWCWQPYLGAGIGIYQSELNGLFPDFFQQVGGAFATTPINATSNMPFAYQFRAGASRPLGERTDLFVGYRYFHGEELTFSSAPFAGPGAPVFNPNGAWTHSVEFGLRVKF
jgi:opacity protein-like surface antigen